MLVIAALIGFSHLIVVEIVYMSLVIQTETNIIKNFIFQMIEPVEIFYKTALANPHTVHCIPGGKIMISMLGDPEGNGKGIMRFI